jgi:hypothetical protein
MIFKLVAKDAAALMRLSNSAAGVYSKCGLLSSISGLDGALTQEIMDKVQPTQEDLAALVAEGFFAEAAGLPKIKVWAPKQKTEKQRLKEAKANNARVIKFRNAKKNDVNVTVNVTVSKDEQPVVTATVEEVPALPVFTIEEELAKAIEESQKVVEEVVAEITVPAPVVKKSPAPKVKKEKLAVSAVSSILPPKVRKVELTAEQRLNQQELEEMGSEDRKDLMYSLQDYYPRKSDNGGIMQHFIKACTMWGIVNILDAAEQFGKRSEGVDESEIEPLAEWLAGEWFLDEDVFVNILDAAK